MRLQISGALISSLMIAGLALADDHPRTVSVDGTGSVTVAPDMARVSMGIMALSDNLESAQKDVAAVTSRVLALTDRLGVDRKYVNSTGASVRPNYRWNRDRDEQELTGFVVERSIEVELRDLDKLGPLIEQAVGTGVNQVSPPLLDSTQRRDSYRQALALAVADARQNAATLAAAAGEQLGPVQSIVASSGYASPRPMLRAQADMAMAEGTASYNAADLRFDASISVVFALTSD